MNADKLNHLVKAKAIKHKLDTELVYRNYMFERLIERISMSRYKEQFIVKGGYLIGSMIGIQNRVTKDIDATLIDIQPRVEELQKIFEEIIAIDCNDEVEFEFKSIKEIREAFDYPGYRISFDALLQKTRIHLKMDITTGDIVVPAAIQYSHHCMFSEHQITIKSYALEAILAEKLESVIVWCIAGTRLRDYYDICVLTHLFEDEVDFAQLKVSLESTAIKRQTLNQVHNYQEILLNIGDDQILKSNWIKFTNNFEYARDLEFDEVVQHILAVLNVIFSIK
jgi:predicted nucleotidyltransferase component of viral defense system